MYHRRTGYAVNVLCDPYMVVRFLNEYTVLYSSEDDVGGFLVEVLFYLEAVCPAVAVCGGKQGCSATGAGVDDDISGVGEYLDETGKQGGRVSGMGGSWVLRGRGGSRSS